MFYVEFTSLHPHHYIVLLNYYKQLLWCIVVTRMKCTMFDVDVVVVVVVVVVVAVIAEWSTKR